MKLTQRRSATTWIVSPVSSAPAPPAPAAQCRTQLPEMPAAADERQTTPRQRIRHIALPEDDRFVGTGDPRPVVGVEEDRHAAKGAAPRHPGEEMRVGDGDRRQTAAPLNRGDRVVVDEAMQFQSMLPAGVSMRWAC